MKNPNGLQGAGTLGATVYLNSGSMPMTILDIAKGPQILPEGDLVPRMNLFGGTLYTSSEPGKFRASYQRASQTQIFCQWVEASGPKTRWFPEECLSLTNRKTK